MMQQIREHGANLVKAEIVFSIQKCINALGIEMDNSDLSTLAEDILDVYKYDSVEDVIQCLKKGRQGTYGLGYNNRRSLNMLIIREWMSKHLEEKATAREKALSEHKAKVTEYTNDANFYKAYKERMAKEAEKKKENNAEENEYQRFKLGYKAPDKEYIKEHINKLNKK